MGGGESEHVDYVEAALDPGAFEGPLSPEK